MSARKRVTQGLVASAVLALAPVLVATPAHAVISVVHVSPSGTDSSTCGAAASPCASIGQAVANAAPGATVKVGSGTYHEMVTINKRLKLKGVGSAAIDASNQINGVLVQGPPASGSVVQGLTVENAIGEGILASIVDDVTISGNTVVNNDTGALGVPNSYPPCEGQGAVPGDCGEGLHLQAATNSRVLGNTVTHNVGGILVSDDIAPTHGNLIANNHVLNNLEDCGITMPSHTPGTGVYDNVVRGNTITGNGGAGVLIAASAPGTLAHDNLVVGNSISGNGEGGVQIHAHTPAQNVDNNKIVGNDIGTNNTFGDTDARDGKTTAIIIFSAVVPVNGTVIQQQHDPRRHGRDLAAVERVGDEDRPQHVHEREVADLLAVLVGTNRRRAPNLRRRHSGERSERGHRRRRTDQGRRR